MNAGGILCILVPHFHCIHIVALSQSVPWLFTRSVDHCWPLDCRRMEMMETLFQIVSAADINYPFAMYHQMLSQWLWIILNDFCRNGFVATLHSVRAQGEHPGGKKSIMMFAGAIRRDCVGIGFVSFSAFRLSIFGLSISRLSAHVCRQGCNWGVRHAPRPQGHQEVWHWWGHRGAQGHPQQVNVADAACNGCHVCNEALWSFFRF